MTVQRKKKKERQRGHGLEGSDRMFRYKKIKPLRKRKRSKTAQEILDRLNSFLEQGTDEPAKILYSMWSDEQKAVSYKELRECILNGEITPEMFADWQQDYSKLVVSDFGGIWAAAVVAGSKGQPILDSLIDTFTVNITHSGITNWLDTRAAMFVTNSTRIQRDAINALIRKGLAERMSSDELAKLIRPCIGLTQGQSSAVKKYYDSLKSNLREQHPRMKQENLEKKAMDAAAKYAARLHRDRAFVIAQTETAYAYAHGMHETMLQAQASGLIGHLRKRWVTSGDDNVCPECEALNGVEVEMDEGFDFKGKDLFFGVSQLPPLHPRCACCVEYIEVKEEGG